MSLNSFPTLTFHSASTRDSFIVLRSLASALERSGNVTADRVKNETLLSSQREQTLQSASQHKVPHSPESGPGRVVAMETTPSPVSFTLKDLQQDFNPSDGRRVAPEREADRELSNSSSLKHDPKRHQAGGWGGGWGWGHSAETFAAISKAALTWAISCIWLFSTDQLYRPHSVVVFIARLVCPASTQELLATMTGFCCSTNTTPERQHKRDARVP